MGAHVIEAECGPDALLLLRTGTDASLVLADYTMPRMNGVELAANIAELLPGLPIVLMTGYSAAAIGDVGPEIRSVLQKPFRAQGMADAMLAALGAKKGSASF
jgi:CheY-like chemotaxis protein